jgi:hypothetical protein
MKIVRRKQKSRGYKLRVPVSYFSMPEAYSHILGTRAESKKILRATGTTMAFVLTVSGAIIEAGRRGAIEKLLFIKDLIPYYISLKGGSSVFWAISKRWGAHQARKKEEASLKRMVSPLSGIRREFIEQLNLPKAVVENPFAYRVAGLKLYEGVPRNYAWITLKPAVQSRVSTVRVPLKKEWGKKYTEVTFPISWLVPEMRNVLGSMQTTKIPRGTANKLRRAIMKGIAGGQERGLKFLVDERFERFLPDVGGLLSGVKVDRHNFLLKIAFKGEGKKAETSLHPYTP